MIAEPKVSLYISVLNEADSIDDLLEALSRQLRPPDEIVFVDGGSQDGTVERIRQFQASRPNVKLVSYPGSNIAQARNKGISTCSFHLIASTDAGCRADPNWLENLLRAMSREVDIVSGVFIPDPKTDFERCVGDLTYPRVDELPDDWSMPSHRSVLFRRHVWESLGGFPPYLDRSEDTWFDLEAARRGYRFKLARDAVVRWRPRRNLVEVFRNTYRWVHSDVKNGIGSSRIPLHARAFRCLAAAISPFGWFLAAVITVAISPLIGLTGLFLLSLLIVRPFRVVGRFKTEGSAKNRVRKNLIRYVDTVAHALGYITGILSRMLPGEKGGR